MVSRLEQLCVQHGLRMSEQRRAILRVIDQAADHPSAEEIYERALQHEARLSIATVYRTMNTLAEAGILSRIELGDGRARYEDDHGKHHEHLVDVDTGRVIELSDPVLEVLLRQIAERNGYRLIDYRLEVFGAAASGPELPRPPSPARSARGRRGPRTGPHPI